MNADKTPFAARLRALSKDASPGPWTVDDFAILDANRSVVVTMMGCADETLSVYIRNAADRLADLVERAGALRHYDDPTVLLKAAELAPMLAALDALDGGGA